jgi:predicted nuclease of restriction endonuclease-like (RecB) superfamily
MSRSKRDEEREFYLRLCVQERWSKRQLERQLAGALFERVALSPAKLSPPVRELHPEACRGGDALNVIDRPSIKLYSSVN